MFKTLQHIASVIFFGLLASAAAQDASKPNAAKQKISDSRKAVIEHWLGVADELSKEYVFAPIDATDTPFELQEKAIFRHTQTVRGDDIGSVYVWKEKSGRPAIVGVIFGWSQARVRNVQHEFHSLHSKGITMDLPGKKVWSTNLPLPSPGSPSRLDSADHAGLQEHPRRLNIPASL